jgi:biopolymer transport protein ExbD
MAGISGDRDDEITDINVTPLVDVMLVLLIIFMVTANYITSQAIKVDLPEAATAENQSERQELNFVIDRDSNLYMNGEPLSFDAIDAALQKSKAEAGSKPVQALIGADRLTPLGSVIKLIDAVRKNGINEFALNVDAPESEPSKIQ